VVTLLSTIVEAESMQLITMFQTVKEIWNKLAVSYEQKSEQRQKWFKMADVELVLNDVLCFLSNKFGNVTLKTLKSAIMDFYVLESLVIAKIRLLDDVCDMNLSLKHPHVEYQTSQNLFILFYHLTFNLSFKFTIKLIRRI